MRKVGASRGSCFGFRFSILMTFFTFFSSSIYGLRDYT
jgi:hypothetical protein